MRFVIGIEYDGSNYHGWQKQTIKQTVQGLVENALSCIANDTVSAVCAGRTDAGVHALEQIVHFDVDVVRELRAWVMGTNTQLPDDIRVLWAQQAVSGFHARYSAMARYYRYVIRNRPVRSALLKTQETWCYRSLDAQQMQQAAEFLVGRHDFSSFRARHCQSKSPVRNLYLIQVRRLDDNVIIDIVANAFLQHMVRNIAGVLIKIGAGTEPPEWALEVLLARDRHAGDVTASPQGLYLAGVCYPEHFGLSRHQIFKCLADAEESFD